MARIFLRVRKEVAECGEGRMVHSDQVLEILGDKSLILLDLFVDPLPRFSERFVSGLFLASGLEYCLV